jgi:colicin import membrane protein
VDARALGLYGVRMFRNRYRFLLNAAGEAPVGQPAPAQPAAPAAPVAAPAAPAPPAAPVNTPAQLPLQTVDLSNPEVQAAIKEAAKNAAKEAAAAARKEAEDAAAEKERQAKQTAEENAKDAAKKAEKEAADAKAQAATAARERDLLRSMQRAGVQAQDEVAESVIMQRVEAEVAAGSDMAAALGKVKASYGYLFKQPPAAPAAPVEPASSPAAVAAAANLHTAPAAPAAPARPAPASVDCSTMTPDQWAAERARVLGQPRR